MPPIITSCMRKIPSIKHWCLFTPHILLGHLGSRVGSYIIACPRKDWLFFWLFWSDGVSSQSAASTSLLRDEPFSGLLSSGFDDGSSLSRYRSSSYRRPSPHKPSSYLISRLRNYESLHKRCWPHSEAYKKAVEDLRSGGKVGSTEPNNQYAAEVYILISINWKRWKLFPTIGYLFGFGFKDLFIVFSRKYLFQ